MDNETKMNESSSTNVESTVTIKRKEFENGGSEEQRVEQVDGGYIITVEKRFKDANGNWQWKTEKSVSTENPNKDNSSEGIATRLESILKNLM